MIKNSKLKTTSIFAGLAIVVALVFAFALTYFSTATADEETPSNDANITVHIENSKRIQKELPDLTTSGEDSTGSQGKEFPSRKVHNLGLQTNGVIDVYNYNDGRIIVEYNTPENVHHTLTMLADQDKAEYSWFYAADRRVPTKEQIYVTDGQTIDFYLGYNDNVDFFQMQVVDKKTKTPIKDAAVVAKATETEYTLTTKTDGKGIANLYEFREADFAVEASIKAIDYEEESMRITVEDTKNPIHVALVQASNPELLHIKSSSENHKEFHLVVDAYAKGEYLANVFDLNIPEIVLTEDDIDPDIFDFSVLENGDIFIDKKYAKPESNDPTDELRISLSAVANDPSYTIDKWVIGDKEYGIGDTGSIDLVSATDTVTVDAKYKLAQAEATELAQTGDSLPFNVAAIMLGILALAGCGLVVSRKFN